MRMAKPIGDIAIGQRAAEEVWRIFKKSAAASRALGCDVKTIYQWDGGTVPGGLMLARLHYLGCDVMYILTGKRQDA